MLLGSSAWNFIPGHVLFDYRGLFFASGVLGPAVSLSRHVGQWLKVAGLFIALMLITPGVMTNVVKAQKRNLTVGKTQVSKNMFMLVRDLCQLEVAGCIIRECVSQSHTQSATPAAASLSSSLALMHAMNNRARVRDILFTRLHAAYKACATTHQGVTPGHLQDVRQAASLGLLAWAR